MLKSAASAAWRNVIAITVWPSIKSRFQRISPKNGCAYGGASKGRRSQDDRVSFACGSAGPLGRLQKSCPNSSRSGPLRNGSVATTSKRAARAERNHGSHVIIKLHSASASLRVPRVGEDFLPGGGGSSSFRSGSSDHPAAARNLILALFRPMHAATLRILGDGDGDGDDDYGDDDDGSRDAPISRHNAVANSEMVNLARSAAIYLNIISAMVSGAVERVLWRGTCR